MALTRQEIEDRRGAIGGDDAAAILGEHPYKTAHGVAMRVLGRLEPEDIGDRDHIQFGQEMEDVLCRFYERKHAVKLVRPTALVHPKYPFLRGNIDRRVEGDSTTAIEAKNTGLFSGEDWGPPGADAIPRRVIIQVSHYMLLDEQIQRFKVLQCFGGNVYREYEVARNPSLLDALLSLELEFKANLDRGILPEPSFDHPATPAELRRLYNKIEGVITEMPELAKWTDTWLEASAALKEAERLESALKLRIEFLMQNAEVALLPDGRKWRRRLINRQAYSVAAGSYIETKLLKPKAKKEEE